MLHCKPAKIIINSSRSDWFSKANTLVWAEPCTRWAELKMLSFWAGGISSFPPCAREYRLLRRLHSLCIVFYRTLQTMQFKCLFYITSFTFLLAYLCVCVSPYFKIIKRQSETYIFILIKISSHAAYAVV